MSIAENLEKIEARVQRACERAGRDRDSVTIVGVSKKHPAAAIREALETTGLRHFGENYVQEYLEKRNELGACPGAEFHLIGHLQRNKVRTLLAYPPDLIHSLDSLSLAQTLERVMAEMHPDKKLPLLVELRLGDEGTEKTGLDPAELPQMAELLDQCPHLIWQGLMVIPPIGESAEDSRPYFRQTRELMDGLNDQRTRKLTVLSYGMSDDFEVAIEEGATHVRIGTAIFGKRVV